jgi:hypothetical protein
MLFGLGYKNVSSKSEQEQLQELENEADRTSLSWALRRAKIIGDKEIVLPGFHVYHFVVNDLNHALTQFKVISALPIERYVTSDTPKIMTWYKFKVIDDLSSKQAQECDSCEDSSNNTEYLPAALLPLEPDEILISHIGGDIIIDGIRVIQPPTIQFDFSTGSQIDASYLKKPLSQVAEISQAPERLSNTKPFLLFIRTSESGKVAGLILGEKGVFSYGSDGKLIPASNTNTYNVLKADLDKLKINSSEKLKAYSQKIK